MKISTQERKPIIDPTRWKQLIYGESGVGKSTLANHMPAPYFFCFEPGHDHLTYKGDPILRWQDFKALSLDLRTGNYGFKTAVIDTVQAAYDMCCIYICERNKIEHISDLGRGRGWDELKKEFSREMMDLARANIALCLIAHEVCRDREFHGVKSSRFMPNINDSLRNIISGFVDLTGRIFVAGFKQGQSIVHRRYITYNNQETMEAKDRFGTLARCGPILIEPEAQCWTKIEDNLSKKGT